MAQVTLYPYCTIIAHYYRFKMVLYRVTVRLKHQNINVFQTNTAVRKLYVLLYQEFVLNTWRMYVTRTLRHDTIRSKASGTQCTLMPACLLTFVADGTVPAAWGMCGTETLPSSPAHR